MVFLCTYKDARLNNEIVPCTERRGVLRVLENGGGSVVRSLFSTVDFVTSSGGLFVLKETVQWKEQLLTKGWFRVKSIFA